MTAKSATIRTTKDVRPKRPKVDRGEEFETTVRQLFKPAVDLWVKDNFPTDDQPDKEQKANVVDNLAAQWTSAIETIVDAATDTYLSTSLGDDEPLECPKCGEEVDLEDEEPGDEIECGACNHKFTIPDDVECPECEVVFEAVDKNGEALAPGDAVACPDCKHAFVVPPDGPEDDPDDGERAPRTPEPKRATGRRR